MRGVPPFVHCGYGMNDFPLLDPLLLSLRVAALATLCSSLGALLLAWKLSRRRGALPAVLDAFCALPLVLPPTVVGYYLILLLGRRGLVGQWLDRHFTFTTPRLFRHRTRAS